MGDEAALSRRRPRSKVCRHTLDGRVGDGEEGDLRRAEQLGGIEQARAKSVGESAGGSATTAHKDAVARTLKPAGNRRGGSAAADETDRQRARSKFEVGTRTRARGFRLAGH
ncbi:MAG: hypothetical protein NVS3B24_23090 [Candidatus Dormibacteria bacterium]